MKEVPLTNSDLVAMVDDEDYEKVSGYAWALTKSGRRTQYAIYDRGHGENRVRLLMHRLITDAPTGKVVDHINGEGLDNRRANLRVCTITENLWNQPKQRKANTSSPYKGVSYCATTGRWKVQIRKRGKHVWVGRFPTEVEAAEAADDAMVAHHGEFAYLNFPDRKKVG